MIILKAFKRKEKIMSFNMDYIRWADWCIYWKDQNCLKTCAKCLWSDLGGYPINQECQFYKDKHTNLTNS